MSKLKTYCFDLDGTLCTQVDIHNYGADADPEGVYDLALPHEDRIAKVNKLYNEGNTIYIETARGSEINNKNNLALWKKMTERQLKEWGVKYHKLRIGVKLVADLYIDDRGEQDSVFFRDR